MQNRKKQPDNPNIMEITESILFRNQFGSVTDKRIVLNYKNGLEELPIGQVSSISFLHHRNYPFAIGGFLLSIGGLYPVFLPKMGATEILICLIVSIAGLLSGIANWIGHHNILISSGGKNRRPIKVEMSKTKEGREFVDAVKKAVLK